MAPTPQRIAQTTTELKKQFKQSGPRLDERQQKQLERDLELDQRAARARNAEERRKGAKKKREEREAKEARARKQIGVGLATQLIGYSHTQAQLKNGMEAFLGVKKRKEEDKRRKEMELTKKLKAIAETIEKEPWDDDDDDMVVDLPETNASFGEQWADDGLDDDSLLEAHDLLMSDPFEESQAAAPAPAPPVVRSPLVAPTLSKPPIQKDAPDFIRLHGPINKAIEAVLDKLPEPLIELLSQDMSMKAPHWDPPHGLLHKLNPIGVPPHRLRVKVGCAVLLLRDLNTSSQLSKSQHLRILRCENDRLECSVLDGQLEGTKTFLTRVPFLAKYRNLDEHTFQRTQFPIRVATDYTPSNLPRDTSQTGFKLPSVPGRVPPAGLPRKSTPSVAKAKPQVNQNPGFKLPGLPASRSSSSLPTKPIPSNTRTPPITQSAIDRWDDFLDSGTQIARELDIEPTSEFADRSNTRDSKSLSIPESLPPMSTQDFDFSIDDLDDEPALKLEPKTTKRSAPRSLHKPVSAMPAPSLAKPVALHPVSTTAKPVPVSLAASPAPTRAAQKLAKTEPAKPVNSRPASVAKNVPVPLPAKPVIPPGRQASVVTPARAPLRPNTTANSSRPLKSAKRIAGKCLNPGPFSTGLAEELAKLRASQLPKSMTGPYATKRKSIASPSVGPPTPKRQCGLSSRPVLPVKSAAVSRPTESFEDFGLSTQDAASFFEDDDSLSFGSPPISVWINEDERRATLRLSGVRSGFCVLVWGSEWWDLDLCLDRQWYPFPSLLKNMNLIFIDTQPSFLVSTPSVLVVAPAVVRFAAWHCFGCPHPSFLQHKVIAYI
jgi:hypothetical protein